jgi:excisionase family DNA binding protein
VPRQAPQPLPVLLLTPGQAAEVCQVGRDQLDEWAHRAGFPVIRDGRIVRIPLKLLEQWLADQAYATNARTVPALDALAVTSQVLSRRPSSHGSVQ